MSGQNQDQTPDQAGHKERRPPRCRLIRRNARADQGAGGKACQANPEPQPMPFRMSPDSLVLRFRAAARGTVPAATVPKAALVGLNRV